LRLVVLRRGFLRSQQRHAPAGTPERRAVVRILAELEDETRELPGPGDREVLIPPMLRCLGRPIPSAALVVCYRIRADGSVDMLGVMPTS
jgi:hypothetical protein